MVPTIAPESFVPNTRGLSNSRLGSPGATPRFVSTPLDHLASDTDPSEFVIPPTTAPSLLRASPPVSEKGMKGSGVTSYRMEFKGRAATDADVREDWRGAAGTSTNRARRSQVSAAVAVDRRTPARLPATPSWPKNIQRVAPTRR